MNALDRRSFLGTSLAAAGVAGTAGLAGCAAIPEVGSAFVRRSGRQLMRGGTPYRIVGANMWYAAWLGADSTFGNRARLIRELDRLQALGINNLRVMAAAEEGPLAHSIKPGFTLPDGSLNASLAEGLDFALAEMAHRSMTAVLVLTNFWEWSGGLQTLLYRATGKYMDMADPAHPWPAFADSTAAFYADAEARQLYATHLERMVGRTNSVTGQSYADDPTILSWQLANEPRPGGSDAAIARHWDAYLDWIARSVSRIRARAPNHLVSLGQEGTQATGGSAGRVLAAHREIDYLTAHIWPLNWGWVTGDDLPGTWPAGRRKVEDYLALHTQLATEAGKPLIVEEFGFPRDGEKLSPAATTRYRAEYYRTIYAAVEQGWRSGGVLQGSNFWAWNGEARAAHADARFREGDLAYMGDPPHEPQGWYGNFDTDAEMAKVIAGHARAAALIA